jgi:hypothetical protein
MGLTGGAETATKALATANTAMTANTAATAETTGSAYLLPSTRAQDGTTANTTWTKPTNANMNTWIAVTDVANGAVYLWW